MWCLQKKTRLWENTQKDFAYFSDYFTFKVHGGIWISYYGIVVLNLVVKKLLKVSQKDYCSLCSILLKDFFPFFSWCVCYIAPVLIIPTKYSSHFFQKHFPAQLFVPQNCTWTPVIKSGCSFLFTWKSIILLLGLLFVIFSCIALLFYWFFCMFEKEPPVGSNYFFYG